MKVAAMCKMCAVPHPDHFECDQCRTYLIEYNPPDWMKDKKWKYCPYCGAPLYKDEDKKEEA